MDLTNIKLVIFDADGTLVKTKSGRTFRKTADDWEWLPGRLEKLQELRAQGKELAVATNQGGVAFGFLPEESMQTQLSIMCNLRICMWPMLILMPLSRAIKRRMTFLTASRCPECSLKRCSRS